MQTLIQKHGKMSTLILPNFSDSFDIAMACNSHQLNNNSGNN